MSQGPVPHPAAPPAPGLLTTHGRRGAPDSKVGPGRDEDCKRHHRSQENGARAREKVPPHGDSLDRAPWEEGSDGK